MSIRYQPDVQVTTRDNTQLATDVWTTEGADPAPTLLVRLPYGKTVLPGLLGYPLTPNLFELLAHGYAIVWQDCRGTGASGGDFEPLRHEAADGVDTVAWIRQQPWSNGVVGTYGASYLGMTQWMTAAEAPEGLAAAATAVTAADLYRSIAYSRGGALSWYTVSTWALNLAIAGSLRDGDTAQLTELLARAANPAQHIATPASQQSLLAAALPWWTDWIARPDRDEWWQALSADPHLKSITVPSLHIGGWFDIFIDETVDTYTRLTQEAGTPEAKSGQRIVIGPWDHWSYSGAYHDRQFGLGADINLAGITDLHKNFLDRWVRKDETAADLPPVRIFVMGRDEWRDEEQWPLPDTTYVDYYFDGGGQANTSSGDGLLTLAPPRTDAVDAYDYDPADPVPSLGGRLMAVASTNAVGPVDQFKVEQRPDVLCYTTGALEAPLEVTGHLRLVLHISSSAVDTDFTAKLVDVHPDGRALYLSDGMLRARYRQGLDRPEPLVPGDTYELTIDVGVTSNVFLEGHRIRLEISSSNFPRYDRNTNTGGLISYEDPESDGVVATNRVLHGPGHPSRLILPVIYR